MYTVACCALKGRAAIAISSIRYTWTYINGINTRSYEDFILILLIVIWIVKHEETWGGVYLKETSWVKTSKSDFTCSPVPLGPTSSVASSAHSVIGPPSAHHVVAASTRGPVIGAGSLHAHRLPLGFVMGPHLSTATLEDLNVPESIQIPQWGHGEWVRNCICLILVKLGYADAVMV